MNKEIIIKCSDISQEYKLGKNKIKVLSNLNLEIEKNSWNAILGASGSGKTTLLNILGALEKPTTGEVIVSNISYNSLSAKKLSLYRTQKIGFVFQAYHLLPELSILENVMLPALFAKRSASESKKYALELIEKMGLTNRLKHRPKELSGGEQQRCAIARALINRPEIILADEPTGNLDQSTGLEILELFKELKSNNQNTIIMITHSEKVAQYADTIFQLENGSLVSDTVFQKESL